MSTTLTNNCMYLRGLRMKVNCRPTPQLLLYTGSSG